MGVLVPADTDLSIKQEDRPWHPVYLVGRDESAALPAFARGCGTAGAQPNRIEEAYDFAYGRPDEEADSPPALEVSDGPVSTDSVRVLVGYVQWDGISRFNDAKTAPKIGLSAPFAGARADEVVARSGTLALRADLGAVRDKKPAIVLDAGDGGQLRFGLQDAAGTLTDVFQVNAAGDVTVAGRITSLVTTGVLVESGIISDGMTVPLPAGVTAQQVDDGQVVLHIVLTPRRVATARPPGQSTGTWIKDPYECRAEGRRVFVRERWFDVANWAAAPKVLPAACNYTVLAYVSGSPS
jgi:hypothetical protein